MIEPTVDAAELKAHALRIGIVILVTTLAISVASFVVRLQGDQDFGKTLMPVILFIVAMVNIWLIRNDRIAVGSVLAIVTIWVVAYGITVQLQDIGLMLAAVSFVLTAVILTQTIPQYLTLGVISNVVLAISLVLLDLFWPYTRTFLPSPLDVVVPLLLLAGMSFPVYFAIRRFPSYSLLIKLFITNVVVIMGAIVGVVLFIDNSTSKTITNAVGNTLYGVADVQASNIGNLLAQQVGLMQALSSSSVFQSVLQSHNDEYLGKTGTEIADKVAQEDEAWHAAAFTDLSIQQALSNVLTPELSQFHRSFPAYSEMFIVDKRGVLISSINRTEHYDHSDEEWWPAVHSGLTYIGDPQIDAVNGVINVDIAIPLIGRSSHLVIGAIHATYSLRDLRYALLTAEAGLGETGQVGLLLSENQLLDATTFSTLDLSPEMVELFATVKDDPYAVIEFADSSQLVSQVDLRTSANLPAVTGLGWVVVAQQGLEASLAPVEEQQRDLIVLGLIALAISSIVVALFGRVLIRPITGLIEATQAVAAGDLDARAEVTTKDEIGQLTLTFNNMADEIQHTMSGLEDRVAERTLALATTLEISRDISTILDRERLVAEVVEVTQATFGYYHVQVYLLDQKSNELNMVSGSGEAGLSMMIGGHKMPMGVGLVGRAAVNNEAILIADTLQDDEWQPNPLLPDTRSEAAIPIAFGTEDVLGVLDVQQNTVGGLGEDDMHLLQSVANQTAVALRNIYLYQGIRERADREATANLIGQKIQMATDVDSVLRIAAHELGESLGVQQATAEISRNKS